MAQNWLNKDGLFIQYGTDKTTSEAAGEFAAPGFPNRIVECRIDLTTLTSTAAIQSNTLVFPAPPAGQMFIEKVEATAEVGAASGTSFSVGLIQMDRATIPSNYSTAFINAEVTATFATAGDYVQYVTGTSKAGGLIGSSPANATGPYYITALSSGTFTTGIIRVRIYYHGIGSITQ
jgi:hypothetical protein